MPRGVAHPPALRAKAVAAVASGESVHAVAKRMGVAYQTVRRWYADPAMDPLPLPPESRSRPNLATSSLLAGGLALFVGGSAAV